MARAKKSLGGRIMINLFNKKSSRSKKKYPQSSRYRVPFKWLIFKALMKKVPEFPLKMICIWKTPIHRSYSAVMNCSIHWSCFGVGRVLFTFFVRSVSNVSSYAVPARSKISFLLMNFNLKRCNDLSYAGTE